MKQTDEMRVTALFRDRDSAEAAYRTARELGYETTDINVVMSEETRRRWFAADPRPRALKEKTSEEAEEPQGSELGGPPGATLGTIAPAVAAVGTLLLIPGIVMAGPVAVALAAAGAVGVAGGLIGALADWGIPKDRVRQYEDDIRNGAILIGVKERSAGDADSLAAAWVAAGGEIVS
jgi:hypothetical protein